MLLMSLVERIDFHVHNYYLLLDFEGIDKEYLSELFSMNPTFIFENSINVKS